MENSSGGYISRLDHLRFVAAFLVFHWHFALYNGLNPSASVPGFWPLSLLREGHTGVAFFMTISGYIFARLAMGRTINYLGFLRNRLYRIYPLLLVWVALYFFAWKMDPAQILVGMLGLSPRLVPDNGWSVVVEFQCYFVFPFLVFFSERMGTRFLGGLLLLSVLMKAGVWSQTGSVEALSYFTIFGRMDQFLCGMIAAQLTTRLPTGMKKNVLAFVLLGVSIVALSYSYHRFQILGGYFGEKSDGESARPLWIIWPALEGMLYSSLIVGYLWLPIRVPGVIDRALSKCGEVSYSLYLGHAFIIASLTHPLLRWLGIAITNYRQELMFGTFVFMPLCIGLSFVTYTLIERPFLSFRRPYLETPAVPAAHLADIGDARRKQRSGQNV